jgi:acetylglutamate kinase
MEPTDVVLRFLEGAGRRSEAEFYLGLFRSEPKEQFAAISVSWRVERDAADAVVLDLRFLAALGLFPTVLLGVMDPGDAAGQAERLRRRLEQAGVPAALLCTDEPDLPFRVTRLAREGQLPLVHFGAKRLDIDDRFAVVGALLSALRTRKVLFLHRPGGLRQNGVLLPLVNLSTDVDALCASAELSERERLLVEQARRLVFERVPHRLTLSITSPLNVLRELFTVKGAGTLLRRGVRIERHRSFAGVDVPRLEALLSSAFGRAPYPQFFQRPVDSIFLEDGYRGAVIVESTPLGAYMSKFAVGREAQGDGIGRDLWEALLAVKPVVYWRARATNPINEWYGKVADGLQRAPEWVVFWKGLAPSLVPDAVGDALGRPLDLPPPAHPH